MSLIHLEKSVFTLHFKEILEDGHGNHPLAWLGLGVLVLGPKLLPTIKKASQPVAKHLIKGGLPMSGKTEISLSQWVAEAKKRQLPAQIDTVVKTNPPSLKKLANADGSPLSAQKSSDEIAGELQPTATNSSIIRRDRQR